MEKFSSRRGFLAAGQANSLALANAASGFDIRIVAGAAFRKRGADGNLDQASVAGSCSFSDCRDCAVWDTDFSESKSIQMERDPGMDLSGHRSRQRAVWKK